MHFEIFKFKPLCLDQLNIESKSQLNDDIAWEILSTDEWVYTGLSSAYKWILDEDTAELRLDDIMMKRRGPRMEPWGTPFWIWNQSENLPLE